MAARRIDEDVPAAVRGVLEELLDERLRECAALDATFGVDLAERVADFALNGGKRLRAQFLWWGLRACGGGSGASTADTALRLAAGLELIQTCALVHDDVMDDSPVRRGRPALHVALGARHGGGGPFGRAAAVLAGDLALSWADDVAAEAWDAAVVTGDVRARVRSLWRAMRTEMVAGQYLDLHGQVTGSRAMSAAIRTATLKSALYSVERPLALGAALAGADDRTNGALCSAGRCAGIAFQLRDDLLGIFGDPRTTGKPSGEDVRDGKPTYLTALARARAEVSGDRAAAALLDSSLGNPALSEEGLERVREVLVETGARDLVEAKIQRLVAVAHRHLASVPLLPQAEGRLRELLGAVAAVRVPPSVHAARAGRGGQQNAGRGARAGEGPAGSAFREETTV
ncbi:polyprenyl synthetase family protein [Streptomyces sp. NBC_00237]|uniref:polyprenyl synthetase family protein n=1 Tax=Streptomyces sp. NBC_00237 TaxID=2975687 RepID=UPI002252C264|nr:polyprenyl synthetase family protein [Streptomyces sp. NBC_00237]MCX5205613.1 polyprenyl synthetase family protein [Streptomyces sp. NBC_00237]